MRVANLLAHDPDGDKIGGNLDNGGQKEVQVHVTTESWSTE